MGTVMGTTLIFIAQLLNSAIKIQREVSAFIIHVLCAFYTYINM